MRNLVIAIIALVFASSCNQSASKKDVSLKSFEDSASYAVGTTIGSNLKADFESQQVDESFNRDLVVAGLENALKGDSTKVTPEEAKELVDRFFNEVSRKRAEANKQAGADFLAKNGAEKGVVTTESGLQYIVLKEGEGDKATRDDQVLVHYTGKLLSGDVFDSSYERNEPVKFYVRSVIPGWTEALQLMSPGAEYKLFIPSDLAYGESGNPRGGIGPNEVLIFDVKLIDIINE